MTTLAARWIVTAVAFAVAVTVLVVARPEVPFAVRSAALHTLLETVAACIGLLAALLAFVRFRRRGHRADLLLAAAFLMFGSTNLLFSAIPTVVAGFGLDAFDTWGALVGRLTGAVLFCAAAFVTTEVFPRPRAGSLLILAVGGFLTTLAVVLVITAPHLPQGIGHREPGSLDLSAPAGHPAITAAQIIGLILYAAATVGFARRADRAGDELAAWLAAAAALAAAARLHYALYPSLYSEVVYSGDFLRLGFYALVLVGVTREITAYSQELAASAVADERRRVARDLHDGLAQELSFIITQSGRLEREVPDDARLGLVASAARRALDESRRAIAALATTEEESLDAAIAQAAEDVAARVGAVVEFELPTGATVDARRREDLVRIVQEAVNNATRHGECTSVQVRLSIDDHLRLQVSDDGKGFDPQAATGPDARGFGLVSMCERARALGGELRIRSAPGEGTQIEVVVPWTSPSGS